MGKDTEPDNRKSVSDLQQICRIADQDPDLY